MKFLFGLCYIISRCTCLGGRCADGIGGNLVFDPAEVTIMQNRSFYYNMLPLNVIVEDHDELSHESLAMMPGEEFDIAFPESGDYTYWCGPHKGAGMIGTVHVE